MTENESCEFVFLFTLSFTYDLCFIHPSFFFCSLRHPPRHAVRVRVPFKSMPRLLYGKARRHSISFVISPLMHLRLPCLFEFILFGGVFADKI